MKNLFNDKKSIRANPRRIIGLLLFFCAIFPSCVTTTTGGFTSDASAEQAVQNYLQLAVAYYDAGDMPAARRRLSSALEIDSENSDVYNVLALIYQREGDLNLADETFRRAIRYNGANSRVRNNYAAFLFTRDRFEEAYDQLAIVSQDTSYDGRPIVFQNLGLSALRLNREDDAEQAFERALQLDSNLYLSALELAQIRFNKGNFPAARQIYNQFLTIRDFANIPHTPRSLWVGIQIEREFNSSEILAGFVRLLTGAYRESPEYQLYRTLVNDN